MTPGRPVRESRNILRPDQQGSCEPVADQTLLEAAEIGPVADTAAIYGTVVAMRPAPIGMRAMVAIMLPIALPMLLAAALQIPLKDIVLKLLKALV